MLKVLLVHLFVTLLINKTTGSNNRHFFTLEKGNKEESLIYSTFCTLEQIEKNILRKRLSQDALSKVHLNKYWSYFKFIILLYGDINLDPGPTPPKRNDILWELLSFHNCSFSTERMDYQLDTLSVVNNNAWNIFRKRNMHFIHLNINSIQSKIDEIRYIAILTNATVIGLSETKLDNAVLSSELEREGYDLVRSDQSRRGGIACFVKNSISYNQKPNFCINTESILIEIFLLKSKPVPIGILYRPPDKYGFANCLERTFSDTNVFESQECYFIGDININLQSKDKEIFKHKPANTNNKEIPHLTRSYLEFCFTHSLEQIITRSTRITDQTATLIDHILTNSPDKVSQSGVIDLGLSDDNLIYCTRKTSLPNSHKHNEIFVCSLKRYSVEKFLEILREIILPNYLTYTCVNDAYSDFIYRFVKAINLIAPSKKNQSEGQLKTLV